MQQTQHDAIVIGAGFAGIGTAIMLSRAGLGDYLVLEGADDLGGTWRDNSYPGCSCDVPSYLYSFSFAPNAGWSRMFAPADEILEYTRRCADHFGVTPHIRYRSEVVGAAWDDSAGSWTVRTADGDEYRSRVLVTGVGALHRPRIPQIPGLPTFGGTTFHSANWDHQHDVRGRSVAVVGTGASAVQFVPRIQPEAARLTVFQRSAPWIHGKPDWSIPAAQQRLMQRFPAVATAVRGLVYGGLEARGAGFSLGRPLLAPLEALSRWQLRRQVPEPALRAALTPDYRIGCKRILLSNDYYPALRQPNVDLVTAPIAAVSRGALHTTDGRTHPADTIVFGTGFDVVGNLTRIEIRGRTGRSLQEIWERDGVGANLGMTVAGFPNLFLVVGPNSGLAHTSMIFMIEQQAKYVVAAVRRMAERHAGSIEVTAAAQQRFVSRVQRRMAGSVWESGCQSWYLDSAGRNSALWPYLASRYWLATRRLREQDYRFTPSVRAPAGATTAQ